MPCENPRRNSQLSREMNFYRERQCPQPEESTFPYAWFRGFCRLQCITFLFSGLIYKMQRTLLKVDRLLRPGGYLVVSGPPVQWNKQDKEWGDLQSVARALCYELIAVDGNTAKKPTRAGTV